MHCSAMHAFPTHPAPSLLHEKAASVSGSPPSSPFCPAAPLQTEAGDQLVLVDFYAKWCVACRAIYPEVRVELLISGGGSPAWLFS